MRIDSHMEDFTIFAENNQYDEAPFFNRNNSDRDYFYEFNQEFEKPQEARFGEVSDNINKETKLNSDDVVENNTEEDIVASFEMLSADATSQVAQTDPVETPAEKNERSSANAPEKSKRSTRKTKTTEFAYLLERKAFRMMRKYYKEQFEFTVDCADYKKNLPSMTAKDINGLVDKFMNQEFGFLFVLLTENDLERIRDGLKTIILCDRYKKKELISEGLDFVPLRNVLHRYNTRNLIEFISDASYAFLYTHFFLKEGRKAVAEQEDVSGEKLTQRMRHLMKESSNYLPSEINSLFEEINNLNS